MSRRPPTCSLIDFILKNNNYYETYSLKNINTKMILIKIECITISNQSSSSALFFPLFFFFQVLLALLVSKGDKGAKLIFFSDSVRTMKEAEFTKLFPTLMWRCLMIVLAWCIDFAWKASWAILVWSLLSRSLLRVKPKT